MHSPSPCRVWRAEFNNRGRIPRLNREDIAMTFRLPENMATRPITILGAGTLGRRIALMLATRGVEVRLYARSAATRDAGVAFATRTISPDGNRRAKPRNGNGLTAPVQQVDANNAILPMAS